MLEIFNEYHLTKYIKTPCASLVDPLHPTPDEDLDMICNLRTIELIIRGFLETSFDVCLLSSVPTPYGDFLRNNFQIIP